MESSHPTDRYLRLLIIVLIAVLLVLVGFGILQYRNLRHAQVQSLRASWLSAFSRHHLQPLPAADAALIQPWMTFDYVSRVFNVSPDYLRTVLKISDPRYPRVTISSEAAYSHTSTPAFLGSVKTWVVRYRSATSTVATPQ